MPRFLDFSMNDTPLSMKKKIFFHLRGIFKSRKVCQNTDDQQQFDLWLNKNIVLYIKDNTPYLQSKSGSSQRKAECEFCGKRHNYKDDICEISTPEHPSGNKLDSGARLIKLGDLYERLKYKRKIRFEVWINKDTEFDTMALGLNRIHDENGNLHQNKQAVSLDACFKQFSEEELLTGND